MQDDTAYKRLYFVVKPMSNIRIWRLFVDLQNCPRHLKRPSVGETKLSFYTLPEECTIPKMIDMTIHSKKKHGSLLKKKKENLNFFFPYNLPFDNIFKKKK